MAIYDMLMLIIMIGAILLGAWRGMAWQLAPIASLIFGGIAAYEGADSLAPWFGDRRPTNYIIAMLMIYLAVSLGVYTIARSIRNVIERFKMEAYDRHLGAILGGFKGVLLCLVVTFFLVAISPPAREHISHSRSGHLAARMIEQLEDVMPPALQDALEPYVQKLADSIHGVPRDESQTMHVEQQQQPAPAAEEPRRTASGYVETSAEGAADDSGDGKDENSIERRFFRFAEEELRRAMQR